MADSGAREKSPADAAKGLVFLIVGVVLVAVSILGLASVRGFIQDSVSARGVVVRQNHGSAHVQIEFTTSSGEKISYPQGGLISFEAGEQVRVLYDPKNPAESGTVDTFGALWGLWMLLGAMGLSFSVVGWVVFKGSRVTRVGAADRAS